MTLSCPELGYQLFRNDQSKCYKQHKAVACLFLFHNVPCFKASGPAHVTEGMTKSLPCHVLARQAICSEAQYPLIHWRRTTISEVAEITDDYRLISSRQSA